MMLSKKISLWIVTTAACVTFERGIKQWKRVAIWSLTKTTADSSFGIKTWKQYQIIECTIPFSFPTGCRQENSGQ
jgi:hypothetical protein